MKLNTGISDLWFNHDHSAYAPRRVGKDLEPWDMDEMAVSAADFIGMLEAAGLTVEFTAADLIEDFFDRL